MSSELELAWRMVLAEHCDCKYHECPQQRRLLEFERLVRRRLTVEACAQIADRHDLHGDSQPAVQRDFCGFCETSHPQPAAQEEKLIEWARDYFWQHPLDRYDITDVAKMLEAFRLSELARLTAELDQVKAERDLYKMTLDIIRADKEKLYGSYAREAAEAALGEKGSNERGKR